MAELIVVMVCSVVVSKVVVRSVGLPITGSLDRRFFFHMVEKQRRIARGSTKYIFFPAGWLEKIKLLCFRGHKKIMEIAGCGRRRTLLVYSVPP